MQNQTIRRFPRTFAGDQLRIPFEFEEEAAAFDAAVHALVEIIGERYVGNKWKVKREIPIRGFRFKTTLIKLVVAEHLEEIKKVVGLKVLIFTMGGEVQITPLPAYS